jgi:iron complex outermembrane receptor protein
MFSVLPRRGLLLLFCLLPVFATYARSVSVTIRLVNSKQEPIPFAAVTVTDPVDSLWKRSAIADTAALTYFELDTLLYFVHVTAVNYKPSRKAITVTEKDNGFTLVLEESTETINEVVIKSSKPLMRQEDDKTIIDPESLVEASTSGYEVLEKTPGLFVDQDGNIYLNSATPATVYINGREMKMSRSDIATMLKSLPPDAISRIEILRTPSAKYDASGSGGIVNVVLKKGIKIGLTGSINAGAQQGTMGNQFAGINLANNNGETSTYINLNYSRRNGYEQLNTDRLLAPDTLLSQRAYTRNPGNSAYLGYGISREWNEKFDLSYDGRLSFNNTNSFTDNDNSLVIPSARETLGGSKSLLDNRNSSFFLNQDFSSRYKLDTAGSEWTANLTYTYSRNKIDQEYNTYSLLPVFGGDGDIQGNRHFFMLQTDIIKKLRYNISLESGVKSSFLWFNNTAGYFSTDANGRLPDNIRTNKYRYLENINAAYIQGSKSFGGIVLKAGLRMENTNMSGKQTLPGDTSFTINRTDFFPYVYLSKKIMAIAGFDLRAYLVYRRTVSRPSYEQLNPFPRYVDQFLSEAGNPTLRPQFTHNYEANVSVDERPLFAVGFNDTRDMFSGVFYQADSSRSQALKTYDNIGRNKEFYLRGLGAIPPGGTYFFVIGAQYNHNFYEGRYEGLPLSFKGDNWLFFTYHQLKLGRNSQLTLNGFMRLRGPIQFYEMSTMGALNLSINRRFFEKKLTVTLNVSDIFYTNNNTFSINQGSIQATGLRQSDSRRVGINLRYNFGWRKKEEGANMFSPNIQQE